MSSPGFAPARVEQTGPDKYSVTHGDDRGLYVEFSMVPIHQVFESEQKGRAIYKDVPHIHIMQPGGKSDIMRPVKMDDDNGVPSDVRRFPNQWAAFQNQQTQAQNGTPLEEIAWMPKSRIMEFKAQKVHTLEQLAALPDSALFGMDTRSLRDKALAFIKSADDGAAFGAALAKISRLETDLEFLKAQFKEQKGHEPDSAPEVQPPKRGPGRPRVVTKE